MGMFDNIIYEADCENCGRPLDEFQSKDGYCILDTLKPEQVDNFYAYCNGCKTKNNFTVDRSVVCTLNKITRE